MASKLFRRLRSGSVVSESAWVSGFQGLTIGLNLLSTVVLTRFLGLEGFGAYQLMLGYVGVCQIFTLPGLSLVMGKAALKDYDNLLPRALWSSVRSALGFALVLSSLAFATWEWGELDTLLRNQALLLSAFTLVAALSKYEQILQAKQRFKLSRSLVLAQTFFALLATGCAAALTGSVQWTLLSLLVVQFLVSGFGLGKVMMALQKVAPDPALEQQLWREAHRYNGLAIITQIAIQLDKLIIGHWDPSLLAIYSIGSFVPRRIKDNMKTLLSVALSHGGRMSRKNNIGFIRRNLPKLFAWCSLPVALIWLVAPYFFPAVYGPDYVDSIWVASWLSVSLPFLVTSLLVNYFDIYQNDGEFYRRQQIARQIIYLATIAAAAYGFGLPGTIMAIVALEIGFSLFAMVFFNRNHLKAKPAVMSPDAH